MFHMDVAKVDRDIVYVAMVVHICCKRLFPMFYLFFQTYVARVFIWMLHMFYTYVASDLYECCVYLQRFQVFFQVFLKVFHTHVLSVSFVFICMLQVLHLDVAKVDWMLHLPPHLLLPRLGVSSSSSALHPS